MSTPPKLRMAIVGLGFGAEFVPIYQNHPNVASVAICDSHAPRLERVGKRYGIERRFGDFSEVIRSGEIDAVHLVSGIPDHAPQSLAVLNAGKHCACTVPMATSLADLRAIVEAQRRSGKNYMMMETSVYTRPFLFARHLRDNGDLGRLQFLRGAQYADMECWPEYWAGLPPMWYATHAVSPLLALANARARKVHCFGSGVMRGELRKRYNNPYPIETAIFQLDSPNLSAEVTCSLFHCGRPYMEGFTFYGENACYEWQMENEPPVLFRMTPIVASPPPGTLKGERSDAPSILSGQKRTLTFERPTPPDRADLLPESIRRYTYHFLTGKDEQGRPLEDGGAHHGSHPHLVNEFISSIVEGRLPWIDAATAANWCAAGICAHESAMSGGREVDVPDFK
jgi:predicted dehydrogenase